MIMDTSPRDPLPTAAITHSVRRAMQCMQAPVYLAFGTLVLFVGQTVEHLHPPERYLLFLGLPLVFAALKVAEQRQRQYGLWAEEKREPFLSMLLCFQPPPDEDRSPTLLFLRTVLRLLTWSVFALLFAFAAKSVLSGYMHQTLFHLLIGTGAFFCGFDALARAIKLDFPEQSITALWFLGGGLYTTFYHGQSTLVIGVGLMLFGLLLHLRWRQWKNRAQTLELAT